ncbi:insulin-like growth factor 2 mRNA-binding protein 3 [Chenopodium quinoa]|uniref:insulin-like growth factor 2 mRNA-binding protein 3 n=1 Tax=Chenopodium quinoa TaxID=63459 RepID=UPI000B770B51|nr:insulin-like growth factor 2 mRNA-binding protein 3 [Chenopodium quinoa]
MHTTPSIHPTTTSTASTTAPPHHHYQPLNIPYHHQYHPHHHPSHQYSDYGSVPQLQHMPLPPIQYPSYPQPHYSDRPSSKRPREPVSDSAEVPSTKRQALGNDILFRVIVPSGQIGKVIGKGGHRVQKIRDDTKATIKIADPIAEDESSMQLSVNDSLLLLFLGIKMAIRERVIIVSSRENEAGGISDAEKALLQIASLVLADDGSSAPALSIAAATDPYAAAAAGISGGHATTNSVKLLIAGSQAGGLIGVSGQNIEKLRNSSGAIIAVLAPNQLPLCTSAHESDRLVQISGEVSAVMKAVEEIGVELRQNPPKQVISISPTYNLSIARAAQNYMDPNAAEYVTLDMVISETMVGGLIGRAGSNISRIRTESGAMIKVFGGKGEQKHRQLQLIGSAQQVALAKQRVDEYIYSQLTQQAGAEQSVLPQ